MPLNKSIVEDAALTWFGELGYAISHCLDCAGITKNLAQGVG